MSKSYDEVLKRVVSFLENNLDEKPQAPVTSESHLVRDVRLDSIQAFEMIADLEDEYGIDIPQDLFAEVETVGGVAKKISEVLAQA